MAVMLSTVGALGVLGTLDARGPSMTVALASSDSNRNPGALIVGAGIAGVVCLVLGIRFWRRRWAIVDTPTSKCVAVFVGRNELAGWAEAAEAAEPRTAPVTQQPAVWSRWLLERWVRRGKSSRWVKVDEAITHHPFWLVDDTGRVLVRPQGAEIHAPRVFRKRAHKSGVRHLHHDGRPLADLGSRYRITEWCIRPSQRLYVLGTASLRQDAAALELAAEEGQEGKLLISTHSEGRMARASLFLAVLNLAIAWAAVTLLPATIYNTVSWESSGPEPGSASTVEAVGGWMLAAAVAFGVLLFAAYWLRLYNRLVAVKQQAANAWSLIDVALRRRHDLLPNLVEVARRYAEHESEVIESVVQARAGTAVPAQEDLPTDSSLRQAGEVNRSDLAGSHTLLALAESYPDLKADDVFQDLARRITEAENQVAYARAFYNDAVTVLRDRRGTFPGILLAGAVRTPSWNLFAADDVERPPPPGGPGPTVVAERSAATRDTL